MFAPEQLAAAEAAALASAIRAVFLRASTERPDLRELRISATATSYPGLAVIEWEFIDAESMAFAAGTL